jgi:hypothetical protein
MRWRLKLDARRDKRMTGDGRDQRGHDAVR